MDWWRWWVVLVVEKGESRHIQPVFGRIYDIPLRCIFRLERWRDGCAEEPGVAGKKREKDRQNMFGRMRKEEEYVSSGGIASLFLSIRPSPFIYTCTCT